VKPISAVTLRLLTCSAHAAITAMTSSVARRTDWRLYERTAASDRTNSTRPRRLLKPLSLDMRTGDRSSRAARHPDEYAQARKLLLDDGRVGDLAPVITRQRHGCQWGALGRSLCVCSSRSADRSRPALLNECQDCFELINAFPDFSATGARSLLPGLRNRIVFEITRQPTSLLHIAQVGIARVSGESLQDARGLLGRLDDSTPLLESLTFSSIGDVLSSVGGIDVVAQGVSSPALRYRLDDWLSGASPWLQGESTTARIMMEVDLRLARVAISVGEWLDEPLVLKIPGLVPDVGVAEKGRSTSRNRSSSPARAPWVPFVSLTAIGQAARLLDLHVYAEV